MIKSNYHTHLKYCNHADGVSEDYVKEAIRLGFTEIGISDHAPILEEFMTREEYDENWCHQNMKMNTVPVYINDVLKAKEKYKNEIKIYLGFETEYIPERLYYYKELRSKVEYINLGLHYFPDEKGRMINSYCQIDYKNVGRYADVAVMAMETGLYNTLVHPDLFMYLYKNINGERVFDDAARATTHKICQAAIKNNVYLELNANGLYNTPGQGRYGRESWRYPYYEFWQIASEYKDLKIIIGADAHSPARLSGFHIEEVLKLAKDLNLTICEKMEINH